MNMIHENFRAESREEIVQISNYQILRAASQDWMQKANAHKYSYHFDWLGRLISLI